MKVIITGANGMVARAAIDYCQSIGDTVLSFTRHELDISLANQVKEIFKREKPDVVLNCAAYTDVDKSESNVKKCYAANVIGVENLAFAARQIDSAFVTISTDYVFDGNKPGFYTQRDTPNPLSIYAKAKFEGEIKARKAYARSIIVRSGWIYGQGGTNFISSMHRFLSEGKPIKVIYDSFGTPTFAKDLARRLRELAVLDIPVLCHVTNSGEKVRYAGFAEKVCAIKHFDESLIQKVSMNSLLRPALRPRNSSLICLLSEKLGLSPLQNWDKALEEYLCGN
jgi:dTDP-4-dehydrorhamnose reductase